jgi:hypothetical protein
MKLANDSHRAPISPQPSSTVEPNTEDFPMPADKILMIKQTDIFQTARQYLEAKRDEDELIIRTAGKQLEAFAYVQMLNTGNSGDLSHRERGGE